MKTKLLSLSLSLLMLAACDSGENDEKNTYPLSLNRQIAKVDHTKTVDELVIVSGNGNYKIICPKKILIHNQEVDYSEDLLKVMVEDDKKIIIEYRAEEELEITGDFLVVDNEGEKRLIMVFGTEETTGLINIKEVEKRLIEMPDFWQK